KDLLPEDVNIAPVQEEISANTGDETFVSSEQALEIAGKFFSGESGAETRALANAAVATITDEKNGGNPAMYVVNYPEGGWAIVSATRNYFPVLAHSDKGSFEIKPESEMGGVVVWLDEVKTNMRASDEFDAETKSRINAQWLAYEDAQKRTLSAPQTRGYNEMMNRIDYLSSQYSSQGWYDYMSLDEAYYYLGSSLWQNLVNEANSIGASTEYTIVAIKSVFHDYIYQTGPLLTTTWSQGYPFNYFCPPGTSGSSGNYKAGCVAVALGQIMNYHRKPALVNSPYNHKYNWNNMTVNATSSLPVLLRAIGVDVDMQYSLGGSGANNSDAARALRNTYGYRTVTVDGHYPTTVQSHINQGRPVYMSGLRYDSSTNTYIGHAWVCDGVKVEEDRDEYFVEFSVNNSYGSYSSYSPSYPGVAVKRYDYYHMNWGWSGDGDGWFAANNIAFTTKIDNIFRNYIYSRENIYITP
ncbi:MAG: C10 family peptidase, partial [Bacteroidales bacterium]|nr:C10 family peptidase [Bacteroidales bacterium]